MCHLRSGAPAPRRWRSPRAGTRGYLSKAVVLPIAALPGDSSTRMAGNCGLELRGVDRSSTECRAGRPVPGTVVLSQSGDQRDGGDPVNTDTSTRGLLPAHRCAGSADGAGTIGIDSRRTTSRPRLPPTHVSIRASSSTVRTAPPLARCSRPSVSPTRTCRSRSSASATTWIETMPCNYTNGSWRTG